MRKNGLRTERVGDIEGRELACAAAACRGTGRLLT